MNDIFEQHLQKLLYGNNKKEEPVKVIRINYPLAKGLLEIDQLNNLIIKDPETKIEKTISYNLAYEIDRLLRNYHLGQEAELIFTVKQMERDKDASSSR